ncbi:helix-turn-helix transcriptional regulator [Micromonospora sagamiensis]|uniref:Transcriptional regulator n=1 Tax=Micromonospora sagamiensis TaxID=47875 RepID=A0A562WPW9_9ACTN|nr:helix-turn-helix domain-containing protein [Micromonospora sagamiensis]TWJ32349.1 transcriptional regulator [Micromonospora sagamiensis]BCL14586.1 transcriptional regulator [Micromonospora sagamiensis]
METPRVGPSGETIDTPRHRALGSHSRVTILRLVRAAEGGITAAEVAARTGQHLSTTRAHLDRLAEAGLLVKARASGGQPGRPAWRYRAVDADPAPAPYRALAAALLDHLSGGGGDVRESAAQVGQGWGRRLAATGPDREDPVDSVITVLDGLGFSPRRQPPDDGETARVHLYTCPFLELVGRNPDAMCGLHLGVVRGVLERHDVSGESVVLEPFGAPAACVVRMSAPAAGRRS